MVKKFSHFANRVVSFSDHLFYSQYRGKEKEGAGREGLRERGGGRGEMTGEREREMGRERERDGCQDGEREGWGERDGWGERARERDGERDGWGERGERWMGRERER